ncbi:MAG TPA: LysR substrate-binding domain-containing protein [Candidatus Acidoferrales bacterium]|nr:LysR substrate-binding domain-containing protein [Candidatus Acidoferrales bacterium]
MHNLRELALVDLNLLPKFRALYRRRSVSAAAHDLHLTQSAVSNALAKMRWLFQDEIFVRTSVGMEPTALAHALAQAVEKSLGAVESVLEQLRAFSPTESERTFHLAMSPLAEAWLMPHLLAITEQEAPNIAIVSRPSADGETEHAALSGLADFAVGTEPVCSPALTSVELGAHGLVCMARRNHPLLKSPLTRRSLGACTFAIISERGYVCGDLPAEMSSFARPGATRFTSTSMLALPYVVEQTDLVAIVPVWFAVRCSASFRITWVNVFEPALVTTRLFWNATHPNDPGHAWMREIILRAAHAADLEATGTAPMVRADEIAQEKDGVSAWR